jgi:hypothetical protein
MCKEMIQTLELNGGRASDQMVRYWKEAMADMEPGRVVVMEPDNPADKEREEPKHIPAIMPHTFHVNDKFTFGKYKGTTVRKVIEDNPNYIAWAIDNVSFFKPTKEVIELAKRKRVW